MIRVTDRMGSLTSALNMAKLRYQADMRQREATTGLRVSEASDDPTNATAAMRHDSDRAVVSQCRDNIATGMAELSAADTALGQIGDLLIRAKEIAITMANGDIGAPERQSAGGIISGLRKQVIALGNTKHDGKFIFSGYATGTQPFSSAGVFSGDDNVRNIRATDSLKLEASVSGAQALTTSGGVDVLGVLDSLSTALSANNITGIRQGLTNMDNAHKQVLTSQTTAGIRAARMIALDSMLDTRHLELTQNRANLADAELTETFSELARAQQALSTTVQISARVLSTVTLVDKL